MWVGNVTEISVTQRWGCNVFINNEFITSVIANDPSTYTDYEFLSYNLTYHSESTKFEGPSIQSIFDYVNVTTENIVTFKAEAPDFNATIDKTELDGENPAILSMKVDGEYLGFNGGPYRLVGGTLNSWNWLKNCMALHITVNNTEPTNGTPGYTFILTTLSVASIPLLAVILRKRN